MTLPAWLPAVVGELISRASRSSINVFSKLVRRSLIESNLRSSEFSGQQDFYIADCSLSFQPSYKRLGL
jgi:hypothetical protein